MSARPLRSDRRLQDGFTLVELLISVAILILISTATVMTLNAARPGEELRAGTRIFTGEINNLSSRAFAGANVPICETALGAKICDATNPSQETCMGPCEQKPPPRVGLAIDGVPAGTVILFADLDGNGRLTSDAEMLSIGALNPLGQEKVVVSSMASQGIPLSDLTITVDRQSGRMRINPCGDANLPACVTPEPDLATIVITHQQAVDMSSTILIDAKTGRVSTL